MKEVLLKPLGCLLGTMMLSGILAMVFDARALQAARSSTLTAVQARGYVSCGVPKSVPGFAVHDKAGKWSGFAVDLCAALASAVLGDRKAVRYYPLPPAGRNKAISLGKIDVLLAGTSWTLGRASNMAIRHVTPVLFDTTRLLVRREQDIASAMELTSAAFCLVSGMQAQTDIAAYFGSRKMSYEVVSFDTWDEALKAYQTKRCQVLAADAITIAAQLAAMPDSGQHMILPEVVAQEPISPLVRAGDETWFEIVRWTVFALIKAEELGITSENVDALRVAGSQTVRQFLEVAQGHQPFGLANDWIFQVIRQNGNYGELFERNLGRNSSLKMERKLNRPWSAGGVFAAPAFR